MNKLDRKTRVQILGMMVEGVSMRSITRLTGISKNTAAKLLADAGDVCLSIHENVRNVQARRIQCDEIWSFCQMKEKNVPSNIKGSYGIGDVYTWTAIDPESKLIASWFVGKRSAEYAHEFIGDLKDRLANRMQLTADGHKAYLTAVEDAFGSDIDYAMLVKLYGESSQGYSAEPKYSPATCCGTLAGTVCGKPDPAHISTSHVERQNLMMRMSMRRFTRLTNGFSKKIENHIHALAIYFVHYNFCRIHSSIRVTPAMEARLTDRVWSLDDFVARIEAREEQPKKRGPYRPRKEAANVQNSN